jgi:dTDP-4-amino-4,6-dideoxygalactose transaminase
MPTTVSVPFVDLRSQHQQLSSELQAAFARVMDRSSFILGEEVAQFEKEFAAYIGSPHAVGVASGLDALRLSLTALGVGEGDEVLVPANTYIATALAVSACGARPVLVDAEERTFGLDPRKTQEAITPRTKAVIPVHLYGQPCDIDAIMSIAARANLFVVEDACQAHGARTTGRACGTIGDAGCFSFYPSKNLGAAGDGGMVVTKRPELAERLKLLRDYGQERKYHHAVKGLNSRLDGLQAAILRVKLPYLDRWNQRRAEHAAQYADALARVSEIRLPAEIAAPEHVYHLYVVRARARDGLMKHFGERGIQCGIHYPIPIHLQTAYADLGYSRGSFPLTERLAEEVVSLPMYPELNREQIDTIASAVEEFFRRPLLPST